MTGATRLLLIGAGLFLTVSAQASRPDASDPRPRCADPSHARLIVQAGRDVCGPTLLPSGPVSVGFLPTACTAPLPFLAIDAQKEQDVCVAKTNVSTTGKP